MLKEKESLIKKLKRRGFKQDLDLIRLCRESYEGGEVYINRNNLFTHTREVRKEYEDRLARAYFLNYVAPIVDTYSFFLFKQAPTRIVDKNNSNRTFIEFFLKDCDKKGTSLDTFMKELSISVLTAGRGWIVMDVPQVEAKTKAEELIKNKRPYIYSLDTENVLDLSYSEDGEGLEWIKYAESRSDKDSWNYSGDGKEEVIVIWTKTTYQAYDLEGNLVDNVSHNLGFVPIIEVKFGKGSSIVKDISRVNRALFNWCSLLDELLYRQTFSWLVVPGDKEEPLSSKQIGTSWAWTFDPQSKHVPQFISPDASQAAVLETRCEKAIYEIYRQANLDWSNSQMANKSGVAKAYDFMNVNKTLVSLATALEEAEKRIFTIFNSYYDAGVEVTQSNNEGRVSIVNISYAKDFSFTAFAEKLNYFYQALTTEFSKTFKKFSAKEIVSVTLPSLAEEDLSEINKEIDEFFDKEQEEPETKDLRLSELMEEYAAEEDLYDEEDNEDTEE